MFTPFVSHCPMYQVDDSRSCPGALDIVRILTRHLDGCTVGFGPVMCSSSTAIDEIAQSGARFVTSAIQPTGFVSTCHAAGLLAIPAAATPTEIWNAHLEGALVTSIYPLSFWSPSTIRGLPAPLRTLRLVALGVDHLEENEMWQQVSLAVGFGRCLTGDLSVHARDSVTWARHGKMRAASLLLSHTSNKSSHSPLETSKKLLPLRTSKETNQQAQQHVVDLSQSKLRSHNVNLARLDLKHDLAQSRHTIGSIRRTASHLR